MLQIILTLVIFVLLIIPIGRYMFHIATGQHTFCDPVFNQWNLPHLRYQSE